MLAKVKKNKGAVIHEHSKEPKAQHALTDSLNDSKVVLRSKIPKKPIEVVGSSITSSNVTCPLPNHVVDSSHLNLI